MRKEQCLFPEFDFYKVQKYLGLEEVHELPFVVLVCLCDKREMTKAEGRKLLTDSLA
jgi:hypothetical protein